MAFNTEFRAKEDGIAEIEPGFYLTEFLSLPYLDTIAQTIEREYYSRGGSRFHYPVILMIKLPVIKCFRKQSYVRTIHLLTEEDCFNPGAEKTEAGYLLPNPATMRKSDTQSELRKLPPKIQGGMKSESYLCFPGSAIICSQGSRYRLYERVGDEVEYSNYAERGGRREGSGWSREVATKQARTLD